MGQGSSAPPASVEELSARLTSLFANKCFTPLELYSFRNVFKHLSQKESGVHYWDQATLCKFLAIPGGLGAGSVVFQMCSYLGAFPFPSQAPAILTSDALLKVVTILTERYKSVIKRPRRGWWREIYRSLSVYDKLACTPPPVAVLRTSNAHGEGDAMPAPVDGADESSNAHGFTVDEPSGDGEQGDDDELLLGAFESMDIDEAGMLGERSDIQHSIIPTDNLLKLFKLLLLIAPLDPHDDLSAFAADVDEERLQGLREVAGNILTSFGIEKKPGVTYRNFDAVVSSSMPRLFDSLGPLFEHFLFDKELNLSKKKQDEGPSLPKHNRASTDLGSRQPSRRSRKSSISMGQFGQMDSSNDEPVMTSPIREVKPELSKAPLLAKAGDILDLNLLSQLSFLAMGPSTLCRNLQPLYSGNNAGFSMGSFEKSVFKWKAPTILLVSGTIFPAASKTPRQRAWLETVAPKRLLASCGPVGTAEKRRVTYGAYIPVPWKHTSNLSISDTQTLLFQLAPYHAAFNASSSTRAADHVYFCKSPATFTGIGFGSPIPSSGSSAGASAAQGGHRLARRGSWLGDTYYLLGPVSLHLDDGLEFGVFTHLASGGGSFLSSGLPKDTGLPASGDWQDKFEIDALEVWGCGGTKEAEEQRQAWKWEEGEAERRRRINLGTGDREMDRELLKMAGIISENRSGGSIR